MFLVCSRTVIVARYVDDILLIQRGQYSPAWLGYSPASARCAYAVIKTIRFALPFYIRAKCFCLTWYVRCKFIMTFWL